MEKGLETFRFNHGRRTYRMAWIVEFCLFSLGISLAVFNLIFGIQEGDILTGAMLAVGWVIIGIIELATIPMAGSFRLAKGVSLLYAGMGLLGLLFLSAFTVYEFNEIASEYMTRGARQATVTVEKLEKEIQKHQSELEKIEKTSGDIAKTREGIVAQKDNLLEQELLRYEKQKENIELYYVGLFEERNNLDSFSAKNPEEIKKLDAIKQRQIQIEEEIDKLEVRRLDAQKDHVMGINKKNEPIINELEGKMNTLEKQLEEMRQDKNQQIDGLKSGFLGRRDTKATIIQKEYEEKFEEIQSQKDELSSRITSLKSEERSDSSEVSLIDSLIKEKRNEINEQLSRRRMIEQAVIERLDSAEFKKTIEANKNEEQQVYRDRNLALTEELSRHKKAISDIESNFDSSLESLDKTATVEKNRFKNTEIIESKIIQLKTEINEITEETAHQYERTMYYRMASWFSNETYTGFGKLPRKEDYNKALLYIFAPVGFFFGLVSIVLAYLGTGFMFDESRKAEKINNIDSTIEENENLLKENIELQAISEKVPELEQQIAINDEETKRLVSIAVAQTERENAEVKAKLTEQKALLAIIDDFKRIQISNEQDLMKAKQRVFDAIRAIPQTITILDRNEKNK